METNGWERGQVTVRLTKRRKELLAKLSAREGCGPGPGAAIDKAIDLALNDSGKPLLAEHLSQLSDEVSSKGALHDQRMATLDARLAALASAIDRLHALIVSVSCDEP